MHASQIKTYMPRRPGRKEAMFSVAMRQCATFAGWQTMFGFACQPLFVFQRCVCAMFVSCVEYCCDVLWMCLCFLLCLVVHSSCQLCLHVVHVMFTRPCFTCQDVGGLVGTGHPTNFVCQLFDGCCGTTAWSQKSSFIAWHRTILAIASGGLFPHCLHLESGFHFWCCVHFVVPTLVDVKTA